VVDLEVIVTLVVVVFVAVDDGAMTAGTGGGAKVGEGVTGVTGANGGAGSVVLAS
jgi:hypothetical protein